MPPLRRRQQRLCCFVSATAVLLSRLLLSDVFLVQGIEGLSTRPNEASNRKSQSNSKVVDGGKTISTAAAASFTTTTSRAAASFALMEAMASLTNNNDNKSKKQKPKIAVRQLEQHVGYQQLESRDRAFARSLLSTTERRMGQIDKVLQHFVHQEEQGNRISDVLCRAVLKIGAAQLLFMESIPDYAAIQETVQVLRQHPKIKVPQPKINFVNAVLRKLSEDDGQTLASSTSVRDNIDLWLANEWVQAYGETTTDTIVEAAMEQSPIFVSVNRGFDGELLTETVREAFSMEASGGSGDVAVELLSIGCICVPSHVGGIVSKWPLYREGAWWVQDPSATLPALALSSALRRMEGEGETTVALSDMHVVDLCCAPGGKTAQLCSMGFGTVDAVELSKPRTKALNENLLRLGMQDSCHVHIADGRQWLPEKGRNSVDGVLLDAPCSATGLGSRRPDVLNKPLDRDGSLDELLATQKELMAHTVDNLLKRGGILVYATCSLLPQEGEQQMKWLLERREEEVSGGQVEAVPFVPGELPGFNSCITDEGWLRVLPGVLEGALGYCDGFFVAKVRKMK